MSLRQVGPDEIGIALAIDGTKLDVGLPRETGLHRGVIPLLESNYELTFSGQFCLLECLICRNASMKVVKLLLSFDA